MRHSIAMRHVLAPAATLMVLAACVPQPPAPLPPRAPVATPPAPVPVSRGADWRDLPQTPGIWTYRRDPSGSIALFGTADADALLTLRCDARARLVYLARAGSIAAPITIRTSSSARALMARPTGGTPPYVATAFTPTDPLLDAMGFSRGRFVVEQAGSATLSIPAWAEVERVTEDCRR